MAIGRANKASKCQYCEIYIADNAPSRSQHENGLRHKGNKDRFIRGLYKSRVKQKNDSEEEKREMKRVEQAAQAAYALDIGAGHAAASSSSSAAAVTPKPKPPPPKPSDPYANYTTAASLGISDPDVDRLIEEAKVRQSEGRAGDWVVVAPPPPPLPESGSVSITSAADGVKWEQEVVVGEVRKREEDPPDDDDMRRFKVRRKTAAVGLGEIYDPGIIRVKPRVKRDTEGESTAIQVTVATPRQPTASGPVLGSDVLQGGTSTEAQGTLPKATEMPSWTPREWKWAGDDEGAESSTALQTDTIRH